jgi:hypothetical protein
MVLGGVEMSVKDVSEFSSYGVSGRLRLLIVQQLLLGKQNLRQTFVCEQRRVRVSNGTVLVNRFPSSPWLGAGPSAALQVALRVMLCNE